MGGKYWDSRRLLCTSSVLGRFEEAVRKGSRAKESFREHNKELDRAVNEHIIQQIQKEMSI